MEGELPKELQGGTLIAAGPGLTRAYGSRVRNPADGDGMVWSLAVASPTTSSTVSSTGSPEDRGGAGSPADLRMFFRNRFVRTSSFVAEQVG